MKKNSALLWQGKDAIVYYRSSSNSDRFRGLQEKKKDSQEFPVISATVEELKRRRH